MATPDLCRAQGPPSLWGREWGSLQGSSAGEAGQEGHSGARDGGQGSFRASKGVAREQGQGWPQCGLCREDRGTREAGEGARRGSVPVGGVCGTHKCLVEGGCLSCAMGCWLRGPCAGRPQQGQGCFKCVARTLRTWLPQRHQSNDMEGQPVFQSPTAPVWVQLGCSPGLLASAPPSVPTVPPGLRQ